MLLVAAAVGAAVLVLGLLLDGVLDLFDLDGGGWLSAPVLGATLMMFGLVGAAVTRTTDSVPTGTAAGAVAGLALGATTGWLIRGISRSATDATPTSDDLVGLHGTVVTAIAEGAFGEVTLRLGGVPTKLTARAGEPLPTGTPVEVVAALSSTSVQVRPRS